MLDRETLMKQLRKEVENIEYKINNKNLYNLKTYIIKFLIKNGIMIDYALPFVIGGVILFNTFHLANNTPFIINKTEVKAKIQTINTLTDVYNKKVTSNSNYKDDLIFQHSTGWKLNDKNLYERILTTYKIDNSFNFKDLEKMLSIPKKQIDYIFAIENIKKIQKKVLEPEDTLYNEDMLFITSTTDNGEIIELKDESIESEFLSTTLYLILTFLLGVGIIKIQNMFIDNTLRNKLKKIETNFIPISEEERQFLMEFVKMKKENLILLDESAKNIDNNKRLHKIKNK